MLLEVVPVVIKNQEKENEKTRFNIIIKHESALVLIAMHHENSDFEND